MESSSSHINSGTADYLTPRDENDINSSYTMADTVFTACFINQCLKHSDVIGMANFAPTVNTRAVQCSIRMPFFIV
ncbi:hypothetical protein KZ483_25320 [Paenibacillus sp. sptzw28]|uniref:alpha-L-arabinofuranosidase C-terminal domain-containing protein n=1 Tax=Paenibacillus sp. sptzw28 TaxID=715179 RepID=UPI001C6F3A23|nr:hypothetical protein KZ483_25320 [Paenibacillus sp. sptzw28]